MKRDNSKDEIDKLFRKHLSNELPAENGWNVPSDDVLFAAFDQLEQQPKKRPLFLFWWMFGVFFLGIVLFFTWTSSRLDDIDKEIDFLHQQITTSPAADSQKPQGDEVSILENAVTNTSIEKTKIGEPVNQARPKSTKSEFSNQSSIPVKQRDLLLTSNQKTAIKKEHLGAQTSIDIGKKTINTLDLPKALNSPILSITTPLYRESINYSRSIHPSLNTLQAFVNTPSPQVVEAPTSSPKLRPSVFIGANLSSLRMEGTEGTLPVLLGYDKSKIGYNFGLGLEQQLAKKILLNYSLSYSKFSNESYYQDEMVFDQEKRATDANGGNWYDSEKQVFTPLGATAQDGPMIMSDIVPENQEVMAMKTDVKQDFQLLELNAGFGYQLANSSKWRLQIDTEADLIYVASYHEWSNMDVKKGGDLVMSSERNSNVKDNVNQWLFGVSATANLQYKWTPRLYTGIEVGGFKPLNSIRNNNEEIQTYFNSFQLNFVTGYRFGKGMNN